jgi:hypothetical protein
MSECGYILEQPEGRYSCGAPQGHDGFHYMWGHLAEVAQGRLPTDAADRKATPVYSGVLAYFPEALCEIARVSEAGNDQHNPGQPLHWAREKSTDEADALVRHLLERGKRDTDGMRHSAKMAWRSLALLQREIEAEQARDAKA